MTKKTKIINRSNMGGEKGEQRGEWGVESGEKGLTLLPVAL